VRASFFRPITVCGLAMVVTVQAFSNNAYALRAVCPQECVRLQPLCDHWSMLMMGSVDVNEGKFCPTSGLKFFSRQVRDYPYYFLGETNDSNLADLFT